MNLDYTAEQESFRAEVRAFFEAELPADIRSKVRLGRRMHKDDLVRWQKILYRRGWGAGMWPRRYGGADWSVVEQHIFDEEGAAAGAPPQIAFALRMVAPVLMSFATGAQQNYFLPRIISGEHWWCQGYSEPGSGSDLASLRTSAVREDAHYRVNGQKTWNTLGQYADWIFCLVRTSTDARPQQGISFLLIDMKSPGITVRPIITIDGEHEINDIFFDNVQVPVENLVGEENIVDFMFAVDRDDGAHRDARRFHIDQQERNALLWTRVGARAHQAEDPIGILAERVPGLLAVDAVMSVFAHRARAQRRQIGPRTGLRIPLAPPVLAGNDARQKVILLCASCKAHEHR